MRIEFEKIDKIAELLKSKTIKFDQESNTYFDYDDSRRDDRFLNPAWWMYQELYNSIGFVKGGYIDPQKNNFSRVVSSGYCVNKNTGDISGKIDDYYLE